MSIENGSGIIDFDKRLVFETDNTPADPPAEETAEEKKPATQPPGQEWKEGYTPPNKLPQEEYRHPSTPKKRPNDRY